MITEKFQLPIDRVWISKGFSDSHKGIDIGWFKDIGSNPPILAIGSGEVILATDGYSNDKSSPNYGNNVMIYHGVTSNGTKVYSRYGHLEKNSVSCKVGDKVKRGDFIGRMGDSGYAFGNHLHFEIYYGGTTSASRVDPCSWINMFSGEQYMDEDERLRHGIGIFNSDSSSDLFDVDLSGSIDFMALKESFLQIVDLSEKIYNASILYLTKLQSQIEGGD